MASQLGPSALALAFFLGSSAFLPHSVTAQNAVGDDICVEGFIMDFFCIDRGTLFDNNDVVSLLNPEQHSIHCLVDVAQCLASGYEVLTDNPQGGTFCRGFSIDRGESEALVVADARATGERDLSGGRGCTTCTGASGSQTEGYRATLIGNIAQLGADDETPARITVSQVIGVDDEGYGCPTQGVTAPDVCITTGGGGLVPKIYAHGSLMIIGWGFFLPSGVITARLFRHRPDGLWFKMHRALQTFGLVIAIAGWAIALKNFNVFGPAARGTGNPSFIHGCLGMTVMCIGLTQPLNALVRPHAPEAGAAKSTFRTAWEFWHKGMGYTGILLSIATIGYGTTLVPDPDVQKKFQMGYGIGCGLMWLLMSVFMILDKKTHPAEAPKQGEVDETKKSCSRGRGRGRRG